MNKTLLLPLILFLQQEELQGEKSRVRTQFVKKLLEEHQSIEEERKKTLEELAEKENDKPIIEENQYKLTPENLNKAVELINEMYNTKLALDIPELVKEIIINSGQYLSVKTKPTSDEYNLICESL